MAVTEAHLAADVACMLYAARRGLGAEHLELIWRNLGEFVASTLCNMKGLQLPTVGNFYISRGAKLPVSSKVAKAVHVPVFVLHEGHFAAVSRPMSRPIDRGHVAQLNYNMVGRGIELHRSAVQRLVRDMLARLGEHILSASRIRVHLPSVGHFVRNKGGRIHFDFDTQLLRYLESGVPPLSPPAFLAGFTAKTGSAPAAACSEHTADPAFTPQWCRELAGLQQQCLLADSALAGYVERLLLERHIVQHCRNLINQLSAAAVLDTLQSNAHGENGAFIVYQPFLQAIQEQMRHVGGAYVSTEPKTVLQPVSTPHAAASMQHKAPVAPANSAREVRPATTLSGMPAAHLSIADREPYPYFEQQEHLPHNRRECDTFNRFHFGRLRASRGDGALTPKVGQEPLTRYEAEYAKQVHRNRSPSPAQVSKFETLTISAQSPTASPADRSERAARPYAVTTALQAPAHPHVTFGVAPLTATTRHATLPSPCARPLGHAFPLQGAVSATSVSSSSELLNGRDVTSHAGTCPKTSRTDAAQPAICDAVNVEQPALHAFDARASRAPSPAHFACTNDERTAGSPRAVHEHTSSLQASLTLSPRAEAARAASCGDDFGAVAQTIPIPAEWALQPALEPANAQAHQGLMASGVSARTSAAGALAQNAMAQAENLPPNPPPHSRADGLGLQFAKRASSPMRDALNWSHPATVQDQELRRQERIAEARKIRQSYELQIAQREQRHAAYASTEDTWPYQPVHHPEGKFPYYKTTKYVAPHHIDGPVRLK